MKTINEALDTTEQELEQALQEPVTIKTLRHIFNHSILSVVSDMQDNVFEGSNAYGISWAAMRYLLTTLKVNIDDVIEDGESDEFDSSDWGFDERRSHTVDFLNKYRSDTEYEYSVEQHIAHLAIETPEYSESSLCFCDFPDICLIRFYKIALEEKNSWSLYDDSKVKEIEDFIQSYELRTGQRIVPADANVVYESKKFNDLYVYICEEFQSNDRPEHEMMYFIEALMCWMCPSMSFNYRSSELLDIYIHDGSERFRTLSEYLVDVFFSDAFEDIVNNASERIETKVCILLERAIGYGD